MWRFSVIPDFVYSVANGIVRKITSTNTTLNGIQRRLPNGSDNALKLLIKKPSLQHRLSTPSCPSSCLSTTFNSFLSFFLPFNNFYNFYRFYFSTSTSRERKISEYNKLQIYFNDYTIITIIFTTLFPTCNTTTSHSILIPTMFCFLAILQIFNDFKLHSTGFRLYIRNTTNERFLLCLRDLQSYNQLFQ